jgi:oligopeptide/dipeptide ABC transporter ATP-binding protein
MVAEHPTFLEVSGLCTYFGRRTDPVRAVDGVSFSMREGETAALVGESGCGKSATALSLARLVPSPPGFHAGGRIVYRGEDILSLSERGLRRIRGREIAYIFQEPSASLNPVFRIGAQVEECLRLHRPDVPDRGAEAARLLRRVGLLEPARVLRAYPHELSGGMQQRAMIAVALACGPRLLVADEPTTALDVTIQAQILELLADLQRQTGMAMLLITHNLGLVAELAHTVHVMYAGRIVESGPAVDVLSTPRHPYTKALLGAVPRVGGGGRMAGIEGRVPNPAHPPPGCRFHPRCPACRPVCREREPAWEEAGGGGGVSCHFWR